MRQTLALGGRSDIVSGDHWDDRNALYALRYDFLVSALYPNERKFRDMAKKEMRVLVEKYTNGLLEETKSEEGAT
ncbi:hypothetical protein yc1106_08588 [Curvularia clavata]|uniref:Uncharacterized protein n=1 Tax=Curvularia clavata TaxID=95742 RepID=A0A9Q8ZEP2_CURCL|nr:hypothetical protein yc1106_08588 [Curvularia clavata]